MKPTQPKDPDNLRSGQGNKYLCIGKKCAFFEKDHWNCHIVDTQQAPQDNLRSTIMASEVEKFAEKFVKQVASVNQLVMAEYYLEYGDGSGDTAYGAYDIVKLNELRKEALEHHAKELTTYIDSVVEQKVLEGRIDEVQLLHKDVHAFDYVFNDRLKDLRHRYEQMKGES